MYHIKFTHICQANLLTNLLARLPKSRYVKLIHPSGGKHLKWKKYICVFLILFSTLFSFSQPNSIFAIDSSCSDVKIYTTDKSGRIIFSPEPFTDETFDTINYEITVNDPDTNQQYEIISDDGADIVYGIDFIEVRNYRVIRSGPVLKGSIAKTNDNLEFDQRYKNHRLSVKKINIVPGTSQRSFDLICSADSGDNRLRYYIDPAPTPTPVVTCELFGISNSKDKYTTTEANNIWILGRILPNPANVTDVRMKLIYKTNNSSTPLYPKLVSRTSSEYKQDFEVQVGKKIKGTYQVLATPVLQICDSSSGTYACYDQELGPTCSTQFDVCDKGCGFPTPTITPTPTSPDIDPICFNVSRVEECDQDPRFIKCDLCKPTPTKRPKIPVPTLTELCDQLTTENNYRGKCWECQNQKNGGIWSAIGCLPTDFSALINKYVFTTGVGIAGGIAFLYFLYGAFVILTSSGNAEKMEEAKQIITSSLAGLLLIIFSVFLLKTIGVDILQLPGFK